MPSTTPNFGFEYPLSSDNLSDGAQSIQDFATTADNTFVDLKGGTTGQYLTKTTNTDMDFSWITLPTIPKSYPTAGSTYYMSNRNFTVGETTGTVTAVANALYFIPVFFGQPTTLDRLAIEVTTAVAATTARLGIYDSDGTGGQPGTLIIDAGTVATTSLGVKEATISQSVSGLVYFVYVCNSASVAFRCLTRSSGLAAPFNLLYFNSANTDPFAQSPTVWRRSSVTGALPTPAGASALTSANTNASVIVAGRVA